jgi:hypothetical protein
VLVDQKCSHGSNLSSFTRPAAPSARPVVAGAPTFRSGRRGLLRWLIEGLLTRSHQRFERGNRLFANEGVGRLRWRRVAGADGVGVFR